MTWHKHKTPGNYTKSIQSRISLGNKPRAMKAWYTCMDCRHSSVTQGFASFCLKFIFFSNNTFIQQQNQLTCRHEILAHTLAQEFSTGGSKVEIQPARYVSELSLACYGPPWKLLENHYIRPYSLDKPESQHTLRPSGSRIKAPHVHRWDQCPGIKAPLFVV